MLLQNYKLHISAFKSTKNDSIYYMAIVNLRNTEKRDEFNVFGSQHYAISAVY